MFKAGKETPFVTLHTEAAILVCVGGVIYVQILGQSTMLV